MEQHQVLQSLYRRLLKLLLNINQLLIDKYHKVPIVLGNPKIIKFLFVLNVKLIIFSRPEIWASKNLGIQKSGHITALLKCAQILEHLKTINIPFGTNGKSMVLGVPILKHFRGTCENFAKKKFCKWNITKKYFNDYIVTEIKLCIT